MSFCLVHTIDICSLIVLDMHSTYYLIITDLSHSMLSIATDGRPQPTLIGLPTCDICTSTYKTSAWLVNFH